MAGNREPADDEQLLAAALNRVESWLQGSLGRHPRADDVRVLFRVVSNLKKSAADAAPHFERAEQLLALAEAGLAEEYARAVPPKLLLQAAMCHALLSSGPTVDAEEVTNKFDRMFESWRETRG